MNARKIILWLGWILASTAGIVVSHLVTAAVFLLSFAGLEEAGLEGGLFTTLVWPGVAGGIAGSVVSGILQWSVLRRHIPEATRWVSIGAAGFAVGYAMTVILAGLVFFLSIMLFLIVPGPYRLLGPYVMIAFVQGAVAGCVLGAGVGVVIGAMSGILQWSVLERRVSRVGWWVLASTVKLVIELIASGIGAPTAIVIAAVLLSSTDPSAALPDPGIPIVIGCLSIVAGGVLSGVITGRVLTELLQAPAETPTPKKDTVSPPQDVDSPTDKAVEPLGEEEVK